MTSASPPTGSGAGPLAVLSRVRTAPVARSDNERCEMCGNDIADEHSHVVNVGSRSLMCTCRACYLLFVHDDASLAYRAVPERYLALPAAALTPAQWETLQIPVAIAFFFTNSQLGRTVAVYPSPAGATESELPLDAWEEICAATPALAGLQPDVEAFLVRSDKEGSECFLVPIDACYELVGLLRMQWRGFDGGQDVHRQIDDFFSRLAARSRTLPATGVTP